MVLKQALAFAFAFALVLAVAPACVVLVDRCADFSCNGQGEVCIDLADGPTCVCDVDHETADDGACIAVEAEEPVDAGPGDAG